MIQIITTKAILLRNEKFEYDISPGNYFLEKKKFNQTEWLMLSGMSFGLPSKEWNLLKNKTVFIVK